MNNSNKTNIDLEELTKTMTGVAERSQRIAAEFLEHQAGNGNGNWDPLGLVETFTKAMSEMKFDPVAITQAQIQFWQDSMKLWHHTTRQMLGMESDAVIEPAKDDRRFLDEAWQDYAVFDFVKQSYLLTSRYILSSLESTNGLDEKTANKVNFYTRQFIDALSPTNFAATNPEVLRETIDTHGENLVNGFHNMLDDLERGKGKLQVRMTDTEAFELGVNVATTPGKVVFQNEMMQLLQFTPSTDETLKTPLLIIPPWINKYYILDLRPKNSFIKWAVDQGHTVFVISWVNPDEKLADIGFDSYLLDGPLAAMDAIEAATGERQVNAIGYCLGGTLLAATLGYLAAKNEHRIKSATFFTSMIDFSEPGELGVFINEPQVAGLEKQMQEKGYLEGSSMATTFNMLRANDLIWSFVINNYLLGKEPLAFDLLYWNSDSTRMPAKMHSYYLREMYMNNKLVQSGGIEIDGIPIDLSKVKTPSYFLSTREDHIAPWRSTFIGAKYLPGPVRFVLGGSGHIAGVVNPPAANKYCYWVNAKKPATVGDATEWLQSATENAGSWWTDWDKWVGKYAGEPVAARVPGEGKLEALEDAPGSYVRVRAARD
jgi:polyhydroxyalkanoate synthase